MQGVAKDLLYRAAGGHLHTHNDVFMTIGGHCAVPHPSAHRFALILRTEPHQAEWLTSGAAGNMLSADPGMVSAELDSSGPTAAMRSEEACKGRGWVKGTQGRARKDGG